MDQEGIFKNIHQILLEFENICSCKKGADVYVSSKKCCEDLYRRLYAMGQLTNRYYQKINQKIDRTYNCFLETGVIKEYQQKVDKLKYILYNEFNNSKGENGND